MGSWPATADAKGARETIHVNDLCYWPPGHNVKVAADAAGCRATERDARLLLPFGRRSL